MEEVNAELEQPDVWNEPERAQALGKERSSLEAVVETINQLNQGVEDVEGLLELSVEEEDQETFYALCNSCTSHNHNHSHIHFKCNSCGEVSCLDANYSITLTNEAFKIENLNVKANGVCKKCA